MFQVTDQKLVFIMISTRMQMGANLQSVVNGAPIDIDSDLTGRTRKLTKYNSNKNFPNSGATPTQKVEYPICKDALTDESGQHIQPGNIEHYPKTENILYFSILKNVCLRFHNNLNTRLLER